MGSIMDIVGSLLGGDALGQVSQQLGSDEGATGKGLGAAIPLILSQLANNAQQPGGADALHQALANDHDGSALDDIGSLLNGSHPQADKGGAILGHVFGGQQEQVTQQLAQSSGLDLGKAGELLKLAAPLVMGYLGRQQRTQGLNPADLSVFLGQQQQQAHLQNPGLLGMLSGLLDQDHDGNPVNDLLGLAGGLLGGGKNE